MAGWSSLGTIILGTGGLITGCLALYSAKSNRNKINSEVDLNIISAESSHESLRQSRELFWREEMNQMRHSFEVEISQLRAELAAFRMLIEGHVPWDWEVIRQLKLAGIDHREPPTLNYIQKESES